MSRRHDYVDLVCMCACYALVALLAVIVIRPDLVMGLLWRVLAW